MRPQILMVNDDGITAEGIKHLYNALKDHADITLVAPLHQKSGAGLSMTLTKPLRILERPYASSKGYSVNGTPADCVKLALNTLFETPPNLIVSGINHGSNAGRNVLYSGTIGGVIEGVYKSNIPGVAFSACELGDLDYSKLERYIHPIIEHVLQHPLREGTLLNVNFPENRLYPFKGIKLARQGKSFWTDNPDKRIHPEGDPYFWLSGRWHGCDEAEDSDVSYLEKGYITAVPIHVDELTDQLHYEQHKDHFENHFSTLFSS